MLFEPDLSGCRMSVLLLHVKRSLFSTTGPCYPRLVSIGHGLGFRHSLALHACRILVISTFLASNAPHGVSWRVCNEQDDLRREA